MQSKRIIKKTAIRQFIERVRHRTTVNYVHIITSNTYETLLPHSPIYIRLCIRIRIVKNEKMTIAKIWKISQAEGK